MERNPPPYVEGRGKKGERERDREGLHHNFFLLFLSHHLLTPAREKPPRFREKARERERATAEKFPHTPSRFSICMPARGVP